MYTWAGPEIAVATTKAYSTQLIAQYLLAMKFAKVRGTVSQNDFDAMIQSLDACRSRFPCCCPTRRTYSVLPTVILRQNTSFSSDAASTMQSRWRAP